MMADYQGEIKSVSDASDMLLDIEQLGQASVKELIPVIGDLSGVSKRARVSAKEMAAALALITQTAGSPAQAATQFRAMEMSLLNTNESLQKVVESLRNKTAKELVDDQRKVKDYFMSAEGQKMFVQLLNQNRSVIQNVANGGRA